MTHIENVGPDGHRGNLGHGRAGPLLTAVFLSLSALVSAQTAPPAKFTWTTRVAADPALTGRQRAKVFWRNDFASPGALFRSVGPAIGAQINNRPADWGRTADGFGRRLGLAFTVATSRDMVVHSSAALLGRDPRYQICGCKGSLRRVGHAIAGAFVSADSAGVRRFDPSTAIGAYSAGYIGANLYPDRYSRAVKGGQLGHQQMGGVVIGNILLEFGPELKRIFRRKK